MLFYLFFSYFDNVKLDYNTSLDYKSFDWFLGDNSRFFPSENHNEELEEDKLIYDFGSELNDLKSNFVNKFLSYDKFSEYLFYCQNKHLNYFGYIDFSEIKGIKKCSTKYNDYFNNFSIEALLINKFFSFHSSKIVIQSLESFYLKKDFGLVLSFNNNLLEFSFSSDFEKIFFDTEIRVETTSFDLKVDDYDFAIEEIVKEENTDNEISGLDLSDIPRNIDFISSDEDFGKESEILTLNEIDKVDLSFISENLKLPKFGSNIKNLGNVRVKNADNSYIDEKFFISFRFHKKLSYFLGIDFGVNIKFNKHFNFQLPVYRFNVYLNF